MSSRGLTDNLCADEGTHSHRSPRPMRDHRGSPSYEQGRLYGVKACVEWLHAEADAMRDPRARAILNTAAHGIGAVFLRRYREQTRSMAARAEGPASPHGNSGRNPKPQNQAEGEG